MDMVMYSSDLAEIFDKMPQKEKKHKRTGSYETAVHGKPRGHDHLHHLQRERAYTDPSHHRGNHGPQHRHRTASESATAEAGSAAGREKLTEGAEGGASAGPGEKADHKHHHGLHLPHPHMPHMHLPHPHVHLPHPHMPHVHLPHPHMPHVHLPHPHVPQCLKPMDDDTEENKERKQAESMLQAEYFPFPF
ncbi:hypothetical protein Bbelb_038610 [Branchiostoma belcheri]|nr:hypothetical protein Bbelb_038610 [Branchiostoma belcheri]